MIYVVCGIVYILYIIGLTRFAYVLHELEEAMRKKQVKK